MRPAYRARGAHVTQWSWAMTIRRAFSSSVISLSRASKGVGLVAEALGLVALLVLLSPLILVLGAVIGLTERRRARIVRGYEEGGGGHAGKPAILGPRTPVLRG